MCFPFPELNRLKISQSYLYRQPSPSHRAISTEDKKQQMEMIAHLPWQPKKIRVQG